MTTVITGGTAKPDLAYVLPKGWDSAYRASLSAGGVTPILLVGDSVSRGANASGFVRASWWLQVIDALQARYGNAGEGLRYLPDTADTTGGAGTTFNSGGAVIDAQVPCWHYTTTGVDWSSAISPFGIGGQALDSGTDSLTVATGTFDASSTTVELYFNQAAGGNTFTVSIDGTAYDKNGLAGGGGGNPTSAGGPLYGVRILFPSSGTLPNSGLFGGTSTAIGATGSQSFTLTATAGALTNVVNGSRIAFDVGTAQEVVTLTAWNAGTGAGTATFAATHAADGVHNVVRAVHQMVLTAAPGRIKLVGLLGKNGTNGVLPLRLARSSKSSTDFFWNNPNGNPDPVLANFTAWTGATPKLAIWAHGINDIQLSVPFSSFEKNLYRFAEAAMVNGASLLFLIPWLGIKSSWTNANLATRYISRILSVANRAGGAVVNVNEAWEQTIAADPVTTGGGPPYHGGFQVLGTTNSTDPVPFTYTTNAANSHPTNAGHVDIASRVLTAIG